MTIPFDEYMKKRADAAESAKVVRVVDTVIGFLLILPVQVYGWYVLALCWRWFAGPLGWPLITMAQAAALDLGVTYIRYTYRQTPEGFSATNAQLSSLLTVASIHGLAALAHWWFA